jgi:anthranilate phosphoribosyltransferase
MYSYLYQNTDVNYFIVHGLNGFDEISLTDDAKIISPNTENIINASYFNVPNLQLIDIQGGNTTLESATIFYNILTGKGTEAQKNVVQANAALAISLSKNITITDAFHVAKESLESGKALQKFKILQNLSAKL